MNFVARIPPAGLYVLNKRLLAESVSAIFGRHLLGSAGPNRFRAAQISNLTFVAQKDFRAHLAEISAELGQDLGATIVLTGSTLSGAALSLMRRLSQPGLRSAVYSHR